MYVTFLTGGTGSGKSSVARELERLGAYRVDLDALSREVLAPGTRLTREVAQRFGADLVDPGSGALDRRALAARAFSSVEAAELLEAMELPAILAALRRELTAARAGGVDVCVVEIPLPDRLDDATLSMADEVVAIRCPLAARRERARLRGMSTEDFDARVSRQPDDDWLVAHAQAVIDNGSSPEALISAVQRWWSDRSAEGWPARGRMWAGEGREGEVTHGA